MKSKKLFLFILIFTLIGTLNIGAMSFASSSLELEGKTSIYSEDLVNGYYQGDLKVDSSISYEDGINSIIELDTVEDTSGIVIKKSSEDTFTLMVKSTELTKNYFTLKIRAYGVGPGGELASSIVEESQSLFIESTGTSGSYRPELVSDENLTRLNESTNSLETYLTLENGERYKTYTHTFNLWEETTPEKKVSLRSLEVDILDGNEYLDIMSSGDQIAITLNRERVSKSGEITGRANIIATTAQGIEKEYTLDITANILSTIGYDAKFYEVEEDSQGDFLLIGSSGLTKRLSPKLIANNEIITSDTSNFEYSIDTPVAGVELDTGKILVSSTAENGVVGIKIAWAQDPTIYTIRYFTVVDESTSYIDVIPDQEMGTINKADGWEYKTLTFSNRFYSNGSFVPPSPHTLTLENLDTGDTITSTTGDVLNITQNMLDAGGDPNPNYVADGNYVLYAELPGHFSNKHFIKIIDEPNTGITNANIDISLDTNKYTLRTRPEAAFNRFTLEVDLRKDNLSYSAPLNYNLPAGFTKLTGDLVEVDSSVTSGVYELEVALQSNPSIKSIAYIEIVDNEISNFDFKLASKNRDDLTKPQGNEKKYYLLIAYNPDTGENLIPGQYYYTMSDTNNIKIVTEKGIDFLEVSSGINEASYNLSLHTSGLPLGHDLTFKSEALLENNYDLDMGFSEKTIYLPKSNNTGSHDLDIELYNNNTLINSGLLNISIKPSGQGVSIENNELKISDDAIEGRYKIVIKLSGDEYFNKVHDFNLRPNYEDPNSSGYDIRVPDEVYLTGDDKFIPYSIVYYEAGQYSPGTYIGSRDIEVSEGIEIDGNNSQLIVPANYSKSTIEIEVGDTKKVILIEEGYNTTEVADLFLNAPTEITLRENYAQEFLELQGIDNNGVRVNGAESSLSILGNNYGASIEATQTEGRFILNTGKAQENYTLELRGKVNNKIKYWEIDIIVNPDIDAEISIGQETFDAGDSIYIEVEASLSADIVDVSNLNIVAFLYEDPSTLIDFKESSIGVSAGGTSVKGISMEIPRGIDYTEDSILKVYVVKGTILSPLELIGERGEIRYE